MDRKDILDKLDDLAKQASELKDCLDIAACLNVFVLGARKEDKFLLKFIEVYSHLNYSDEERKLWEELRRRVTRTKDRNIAMQIRKFLLDMLRMSPKDPDFSNIKKEVMSDPPRYDLFLDLLKKDSLPVEPIKIFQMKELVEGYAKTKNVSH